MQYRRSQQTGSLFFFTINLAERHSDLLIREIELLRSSFRKVKSMHPFSLPAVVVMPDHLHLLMQLPDDDNDYPLRIRLIKTHFSKGVDKVERIRASRRRKGERGIWQRRYWEHQIRDDRDRQAHVDYIHYNPVKHGYVSRPADWRYSSIQQFIARGWVRSDWGVVGEISDRGYGNE